MNQKSEEIQTVTMYEDFQFEEPYDSEYLTLKQSRKALEKAFKKGRVSEIEYRSRADKLDIELRERWIKHFWQQLGGPSPKVKNGHIVIDLKCACGWEGILTYGKTDATFLGKDMKGYIYFECPVCNRHIQYCWWTGKNKTRKGLLGTLFGRFS